jgi:hypothetical protein
MNNSIWGFDSREKAERALRGANSALGRGASGVIEEFNNGIPTFAKITEALFTVDIDGEDIEPEGRVAKAIEVVFNPITQTYDDVPNGLIFDGELTGESENTGYVFSKIAVELDEVVELIYYVDKDRVMQWLVRQTGSGATEESRTAWWVSVEGPNTSGTVPAADQTPNDAETAAKPKDEWPLISVTVDSGKFEGKAWSSRLASNPVKKPLTDADIVAGKKLADQPDLKIIVVANGIIGRLPSSDRLRYEVIEFTAPRKTPDDYVEPEDGVPDQYRGVYYIEPPRFLDHDRLEEDFCIPEPA